VNTPLSSSGMARVFKGSHGFTCTPRVDPLTEWTVPAELEQKVSSLNCRPFRIQGFLQNPKNPLITGLNCFVNQGR